MKMSWIARLSRSLCACSTSCTSMNNADHTDACSGNAFRMADTGDTKSRFIMAHNRLVTWYTGSGMRRQGHLAPGSAINLAFFGKCLLNLSVLNSFDWIYLYICCEPRGETYLEGVELSVVHKPADFSSFWDFRRTAVHEY